MIQIRNQSLRQINNPDIIELVGIGLVGIIIKEKFLYKYYKYYKIYISLPLLLLFYIIIFKKIYLG